MISGRDGERSRPAAYVREYVELAHASTAYGAQGETVGVAHRLVREQTGAASAYVGMTRGRFCNVAHLVAESLDDARDQWIAGFSRDRADLGPATQQKAPPRTSIATARWSEGRSRSPRRQPHGGCVALTASG